MRLIWIFLAIFIVSFGQAVHSDPLGAAFTYQGELVEAGVPGNGNYQMTFELFDAVSGGNSKSMVIGPFGVNVSDGIFTVELDFGPGPFDGEQLWLDIRIGAVGLSPRQKLTASPYALAALSKNYDRVAMVSPSGGNYPDPVSAMNGLSDWCGTLPLADSCLVYILPGTYELSGELRLEAKVDIIGVDSELVKLSRPDTGTGGVLEANNCGSNGCYIANMTLLTIDNNTTFGTSTIVSSGGKLKGKNIRLIVNGNADNSSVSYAILSDSDIEMDKLSIDWESPGGSAIRVTSDSKLQLSDCDITANGLTSESIRAIDVVNTAVETRNCRIKAINNHTDANAFALRIINGAYEDLNSFLTADAGFVGYAFFIFGCSLGDVQLNGTRFLALEAETDAIGAFLRECTVEAHRIHTESRGVNGAGLSITLSTLELSHSTVLSGDDAITYGLVTPEPKFQNTISWSLLKAPNSLVDSISEIESSVSFSRLEDGTVGNGVTCAYNVDENLVDVVCP